MEPLRIAILISDDTYHTFSEQFNRGAATRDVLEQDPRIINADEIGKIMLRCQEDYWLFVSRKMDRRVADPACWPDFANLNPVRH